MPLDLSKYQGQQTPPSKAIGLWIFNIDDKDICFWGNYDEVVKTAELYLKTKNMQDKTIYLIDCIDYSYFFNEDFSINRYIKIS
ncbi:MAG TPA: hypothetical protein PLT82_01060 [Candidatus Hydrogenedens sp.]|nr:hypothetical protein [Candidatus Hydrogenedens sp.]HOL20495.1 hypothetical protein [Candidatus Hydrogenedens sp.]HPP57701.1 hypothetical protein [Candidatus Hydrogenedens sp.]